MRYTLTVAILLTLWLLVGCTGPQVNPCPDVPKISDYETVKDYTVRLINQYKICRAHHTREEAQK